MIRHLAATGGARRPVRPGRKGALSLHGAHVRRPRPRGGCEELVLCVPPGPGGAVASETLAAAAIAGIGEVYRVGAPRPWRPWRSAPSPSAGRRHRRPREPLRGRGQAPGVGIVGVPSAFAGPSEVVVVADAATPVAWAAIDLVVQAEHGPDGLAWLVTWSPTPPTPSMPRSAGWWRRRRGAPISRRRSGVGGTSPWWTGPRRRWRSPTRWRPSTWSCSWKAPPPSSRRCAAPVRCSWGPTRPPAWATTSPGPTTCSPRPHGASRRPCGSTTSAPTSMPCRWTATPGPPGTACGRHRPGRGTPGPRRVRARAGRDVMGGPVPPRADLRRSCRDTTLPRSTSRSASTPTSRRCRHPRSGSTSCATNSGGSTSTAIPIATSPSYEAPGRVPRRRPGPGVLRQRVQRGAAVPVVRLRGAGRSVALFEPTYALHSHIASLTATSVVAPGAARTTGVDLDAVDRLLESHGR